MKSLNLISTDDYNKALHESLLFYRKNSQEQNLAGHEYYIGEVIRELYPTYGESLFQEGYKIYTACDPTLQKLAQQTLEKGRYQAALVAIDPASGRVLALAGGRNYAQSQYNRATQSHRQPGSIFKPFVVAAALKKNMTAATFLLDKKKKFIVDKKTWKPANFEDVYHGTVTVREALAESMNLAIIDLAYKVGLSNVVEMARTCGIQTYLAANPSVALGSYETSLLNITSAYAPFSNGGYQITPLIVESVRDSDDNILELHTPESNSVLTNQESFLMTSLLQSVFDHGTAKGAKALGWTYPSAGKTGTTNDGKDAWFIGYTNNLLVGTWMGDDQAKAINITGAHEALPLWVNFMKGAYEDVPPTAFVEPPTILHKKIDITSGELARSGCQKILDEIFIPGTEPIKVCHLHPGGIRGWFRRTFGSKK